MNQTFPTLVIAGLGGDSGKTVVATALALVLRERGIRVATFKKGPDYIDAAWLTWAGGRPARNLDTWMMGAVITRDSFLRHALPGGINIVEGNRGVFDGSDAKGTHSTAELAKLLGAPVILVVDASKVTRTAAACVLGCQALDPNVRFAGVILNRVGGVRHERVLREAIETICHLPVLGAIPRADGRRLLPGRHLGLVTPPEHEDVEALRQELHEVAKGLDVDSIVAMALDSSASSGPNAEVQGSTSDDTNSDIGLRTSDGGRLAPPAVKIGYLLDSAFTFYYPENLEALQAEGADLVPVSALEASSLPADLDALYIGGGFPETHAARLASNKPFLDSLRDASGRGLPIYAECGGLMLLSRAIAWEQQTYRMAAVLPFDVDMHTRPRGHGYTHLVVDRANPFFAEGTVLRGHEFHYSQARGGEEGTETACSVLRGSGCFAGREGVVFEQVFATYTHVHALATPEWAPGVVAAARRFNAGREWSRNPARTS